MANTVRRAPNVRLRYLPSVEGVLNALLIAGMVLASHGSLGAGQVKAIKAGSVLDPAAGTVVKNQTILIEGSRIAQVGSDIPLPVGTEVIDLSRSTVLPGLFDCHTHLCVTVTSSGGRPGMSFLAIVTLPTPFRAIQGVVNAREMLEAGFTTVRDLGNAGDYADTALRQAVD